MIVLDDLKRVVMCGLDVVGKIPGVGLIAFGAQFVIHRGTMRLGVWNKR